MKGVNLTLLRGPHTMDAIDELVDKLEDQDIVLFENIMPKSQLEGWLKALNALSNNEEYIKAFEKDLENNLKNQFVANVVWRLRGKSKLFDFVDITLSDDNPERDYERMSIAYGVVDVLEEAIEKPKKRYELVDAHFSSRAQVLIHRNEVVKQQLSRILDSRNKGLIAKLVSEKGFCNIAVVQGYLHNIADDLRVKYPDIKVRDVLYDEKNLIALKKNPTISLLTSKIKEKDKALDHKAIDYFLLCILTYAKANADKAHSKAGVEGILELTGAGFKHQTFVESTETFTAIGPIEKYTAPELKRKVEDLLTTSNFN